MHSLADLICPPVSVFDFCVVLVNFLGAFVIPIALLTLGDCAFAGLPGLSDARKPVLGFCCKARCRKLCSLCLRPFEQSRPSTLLKSAGLGRLRGKWQERFQLPEASPVIRGPARQSQIWICPARKRHFGQTRRQATKARLVCATGCNRSFAWLACGTGCNRIDTWYGGVCRIEMWQAGTCMCEYVGAAACHHRSWAGEIHFFSQPRCFQQRVVRHTACWTRHLDGWRRCATKVPPW